MQVSYRRQTGVWCWRFAVAGSRVHRTHDELDARWAPQYHTLHQQSLVDRFLWNNWALSANSARTSLLVAATWRTTFQQVNIRSRFVYCIIVKKTFNALNTLILRKQKCLQRLSVSVHSCTFRIPKVIRQWVPDGRASNRKCPTAVCAKMTMWHGKLVTAGQMQMLSENNIRFNMVNENWVSGPLSFLVQMQLASTRTMHYEA